MKKTYVLDTNILLTSPNAIFGFDDNTVVITGTTLQELDSKKNLKGEIGYNAREVSRIIEELRLKGDLTAGVKMKNGGKFRIYTNTRDNLPNGFDLFKADNRIISSVKLLAEENKTKDVVLVTNDTFMRVNASVCGLDKVEFYRNDHISSDKEYTGRCELNEKELPFSMDELRGRKNIPIEVKKLPVKLEENEFLTIKGENDTILAIWQDSNIKVINTNSIRPCGITPRNSAQFFALYALMAPVEDIPFVILKGAAGTAKTFLSLAAGLDKVYDTKQNRKYNKVLISRNNVTADDDFGYLPGNLDEKMTPLLAPFYDNLESLLRGKTKNEEEYQIKMQIEDLFADSIIDICPLAYMRGRSITNSYLIVDETQNATRSQIRDIITRAGEGTKVVICGDPEQIDAHALDKWNNGLVFAAEKMKGSRLCAQVKFDNEESVRSNLAKEAINRLIL